MSDFIMDRASMLHFLWKACSRGLLTLGLAALCVGACGGDAARPRELPYPSFEPEAPFPELATARSGKNASGSGEFERLLGAGAASEESAEAQLQSVPLGGLLTGQIPTGDAWRWSSAGGIAIVVYSPAASQPAALIYAESFGSLIQSRPAEEHHRFQVAVDPQLAEGYLDPPAALELASGGPLRQMAQRAGLSRSEAGQLTQLLATRTGGRGLGFLPAGGTFTGWRWVGRNRHGLTLRIGRQIGTWSNPPPLPERFQQAVELLGGRMEGQGGTLADRTAREMPAALVLGSAAAPHEQSGIHIALLCVQAPECPVAQELATFLGSLQIGDPGLVERLLAGPSGTPEDLARAAGIEIRPRPE